MEGPSCGETIQTARFAQVEGPSCGETIQTARFAQMEAHHVVKQFRQHGLHK